MTVPAAALTERLLIGDGWIAPRARFTTDAPLLPLNGEWDFRLSPSPAVAPDDLAEADGTGWERIPVPSSWPMQGHGLPWYTNTRFPFPVDPPHVPDANPVGDFHRTFDWPEADTRALLRLDGVDAIGEVWVNGVRLGSTAGSRLVHEFDLTDVLRQGDEHRRAAGDAVGRHQLPGGPGHVVAAGRLPRRRRAGDARRRAAGRAGRGALGRRPRCPARRRGHPRRRGSRWSTCRRSG